MVLAFEVLAFEVLGFDTPSPLRVNLNNSEFLIYISFPDILNMCALSYLSLNIPTMYESFFDELVGKIVIILYLDN